MTRTENLLSQFFFSVFLETTFPPRMYHEKPTWLYKKWRCGATSRVVCKIPLLARALDLCSRYAKRARDDRVSCIQLPLYARYLCSRAHSARPSARATIWYLVYNFPWSDFKKLSTPELSSSSSTSTALSPKNFEKRAHPNVDLAAKKPLKMH